MKRLFVMLSIVALLGLPMTVWGGEDDMLFQHVQPAPGKADTSPGVPDLTDPGVQSEMVLLSVTRLDGDPDFPVLVLESLNERFPRYLLVIVDARNGKETWSLLEDRPVVFLLFSDSATVQRALLDEGFAANGVPSGNFVAVGTERVEELVNKLRESRRQAAQVIL